MQPSHNLRYAVPTMRDEDLFNLYKHPEEFPNIHIDTNDTLMGGIWERRWRQAALLNSGLPEQELLAQGHRPSVIRAMYIAEAAGYHAWWDIMALDLQFHHFTPAGQNITEWVAEANAAPGQDPQEAVAQWEKDHQNDSAKAAPYLERHPENGQQRYRLLRHIANDTLQTGQHLTYIGLYLDLPDLLAHGRQTIALSQARLWDRVTHEKLDNEVFQKATAGDNAGQQATSYVDFIIQECTTGNATDEQIIREFAAQAYTFRWASRAADRNMDRLSKLGSQDGGIAGQLRAISDEIFHDRKHGIVDQATLHLGDRKQVETERAFQQLKDLEEGITAIAYGQNLRYQADRNTPDPQVTKDQVLDHLTGVQLVPELATLATEAKADANWENFFQHT